MSKSMDIRLFQGMVTDLPGLTVSVKEVRNALPIATGYQLLKSLAQYTDALDAYCGGAASFKDSNETPYTYAGDRGASGVSASANLYGLVDDTWNDYSRVAGYSEETQRWEFARIGDSVVATNFKDHPQTLTMGGTTFADLTTDFKACTVARVRDFLMFGNTDDTTDGKVPHRVRWSGYRDITTYTIDPDTQSDFQDLEGGAVRRIMGGEEAMIFCDKSIFKAMYVGAPLVFQIDEIDKGVGVLGAGSVIEHGDIYFLSNDGFRKTSGGKSSLVGEEVVNRTVLQDLDRNYSYNITGAYDEQNGVFIWAYPGAGATSGRPNKLVIYNPSIDRWTFGDQEAEVLFQSLTPFVSLEGLDSLYASLEDIPGSLDDSVWQGGESVLGAFNSSHIACFFTGDARTATILTGEAALTPGRQTFLAGIRPLIDGGSVLVRIAHRLSLSEDKTWTSKVASLSNGLHGIRVSSRYMQAEFTITGDFKNAIGFEPYGRPAGAR